MPGESPPIEVSRGCIFRCKFCSFPLNGRAKDDENHLKNPSVLYEEFMRNWELYGVRRYMFSDDTYNDSVPKMEHMNEVVRKHFFERLMLKKTKVVFYTHRVASLSKSINIRTQSSKDSWFRIMKAALVMAALTAWNNERTKASLLVIDPGNFQSPLNPNNQTSAQERAVKIVEYCSAWRGGFNCVNTSNGEESKL